MGENSDYNENQLNYIHLNKTAALLTVAMTMGAKIAEANEEDLQKVTLLGRNLGLATCLLDIYKNYCSIGRMADSGKLCVAGCVAC